jgi:hypothetical protein
MPEATKPASDGGICTQNAPREPRVLKVISEAPESAKGSLTRAFSGAASPSGGDQSHVPDMRRV